MAFKTFFKLISKLIMVKQTLFALPFALVGVLFAGGGSFSIWMWVITALVAARTAGMSFNRVIDAAIDAKNPRTKDRVIPAGELKSLTVWLVAAISSAVLILSSYMLNELCFKLSFLAVFLLFTYSFFKRFSASSHFYLGLVEAVAPMGGYLAVSGEFALIPFILGFIILSWIAGLDIIYAFQDIEFDQKENLHSLPAMIGENKALACSLACYASSAAAIVLAGVLSNRGLFYWIGFIIIILLFSYQQILARKGNVNKTIKNIFQANLFISPALFFGTLMDIWLANF
jgi:4-hydroxybenzoate polyprenyltransferase